MIFVANDASLGRQALRRSVNERIRSSIDGDAPGSLEVFCECGRSRCSERLRIAVDEYDDVLGAGGLYVVVPGHEDGGSERAVTRNEDVLVVERQGR